MATHKQQFQTWKKEKNINVLKSLENSQFKIGDKVNYTNPYGVVIENKEVLGFCEEPTNGRSVYLDMDCYWFPVNPNNLVKL